MALRIAGMGQRSKANFRRAFVELAKVYGAKLATLDENFPGAMLIPHSR